MCSFVRINIGQGPDMVETGNDVYNIYVLH